MHFIKTLELGVANSSVLPILHVFSALVCAETPLQEQRLVSLMEKTLWAVTEKFNGSGILAI